MCRGKQHPSERRNIKLSKYQEKMTENNKSMRGFITQGRIDSKTKETNKRTYGEQNQGSKRSYTQEQAIRGERGAKLNIKNMQQFNQVEENKQVRQEIGYEKI